MMLFLPDADYETDLWGGLGAAHASGETRAKPGKEALAAIHKIVGEAAASDLLGEPDPLSAPCRAEDRGRAEDRAAANQLMPNRRSRRSRSPRSDLSVARTRAADRNRGAQP